MSVTDFVDCPAVAERGLIEGYVARTLDEDDVRAFEVHYLGCAQCQADIRAAVAARAELATPPTRRRMRVGVGFGAVAAAIAGILLFPRTFGREPLAALGKTSVAPVYLGVPIRSSADDSAFAVGMAAYSAGEYADAVKRLERVSGSGSLPAGFFRASSLLMLGKAEEAAAGFSRVIAAGPSPYLAEAYFYRAKAHLLRGRADDALSDLTAAALDEVVAPRAIALADSVRGLRPR